MLKRSEPKKKEFPKLILDSNALFVPLQFKLDIFEELNTLMNANYEPILLSPNRQEMERLTREGSLKTRKEAAYALKLAEKCRLVELEIIGASADDVIVEVANKWKCPVFTNDRLLRKRLRDINVPVIYVRQKSRLEIDGGLKPCLNL
jgi:rRNA-processing protein FCF1